MKLLLDQNISFRVIKPLTQHFEKVAGVKELGLTDKDDLEIWKFSKAEGYTIVTNDEDFSILSSYYGAPPKIIWIRKGNLSNKDFALHLIMHKHLIEDFISDSNLEKSILQIY